MPVSARPNNTKLLNTLTVNCQNDLAALTASLQQSITRSLMDSMDEGDSAYVTASNIMDATGMERNRAMLIARTETMNAYRDASTDQYRKYGVQSVKWLSASDDRTCDECLSLDGQIFDIDEIPDVHSGTNIQCRCVQLPVVGDESQ